MNNQMPQQETSHEAHRTLSRSRWVLIGFLIVIAYFLFTEHRAHVIPYLPFLLFAACPLMHLFMHHGHHHGHRHSGERPSRRVDGEGE
ncbi:DUF2933 domain-containing protein [Pandoraea pnomenusa]|uniref:DUF2933 domain-containing protein n=1 Tax=Pandoraea pnomenusa TaxID=93220 RepID=UPI003CE966C5